MSAPHRPASDQTGPVTADAAPPSPPPDDRDWTWVLQRPCPDCGFDAGTHPVDQTGDRVRSLIEAWQRVLARPDVAIRPAPTVWSPLEYGAHVRDVFRVYDVRLARMLTEDGPHYDNWDQDRTAVEERYDLERPAAVAAALTTAGVALADRFDGVAGEAWQRTGYRSDGAAFTIESFARYFVHDPIHHLHDVGGSTAIRSGR